MFVAIVIRYKPMIHDTFFTYNYIPNVTHETGYVGYY